MQILRDLFPTDAGTPYFTLALETRDLHAHSLLSGLGEDDRSAIADALADAVETIARVLREAILVKGIKATLTFKSEVSLEFKSSIPLELKPSWSKEGALTIETASEFYIAGQMAQYLDGGLQSGGSAAAFKNVSGTFDAAPPAAALPN